MAFQYWLTRLFPSNPKISNVWYSSDTQDLPSHEATESRETRKPRAEAERHLPRDTKLRNIRPAGEAGGPLLWPPGECEVHPKHFLTVSEYVKDSN